MDTNYFAGLYAIFRSPIAAIDCGGKCSPYNERGVPFCCDTRHAIPTSYEEEWDYLIANTDLWHLWQGKNSEETNRIRKLTPEGQILIECKGHLLCQRDYRSITCRAYPFYPYIDSTGSFIGLSYYWEYEDRCWLISNLDIVSQEFRQEFVAAYENIFLQYPEEKDDFKYHAERMRREFHFRKRSIILLHRKGYYYKISPNNERLRRIKSENLPKYGVYRLSVSMPFTDEQ